MLLNDKDFLEIFIDTMVYNTACDGVSIVDNDFRYLYLNELIISFIGIPVKQILGKRLGEIRPDLCDLIDTLKKINAKITNTPSFQRNFIIIKEDVTSTAIDLTTSPIINPYTKNRTGYVSYVSKVILHNPMQEVIKKLNNKYTIFKPINTNEDSPIQKFNLTTVEHEILILLCIGKSHKEIADILYRLTGKQQSNSNIANIIYRKLFSKFSVTSISGLIEKAISLNIIHYIPESFI